MKTIVKKGNFVTAPISNCDYLTPNKRYEVTRIVKKQFFVIIADDGDETYCSLINCDHLYGQNWLLN
jgi:hypothetical protein